MAPAYRTGVRGGRAFFLSVAALLGGTAPGQCQTASPAGGVDLLNHARKVAQTDDWHGARFHYSVGPLWISDDVLIHTRSSGKKAEHRAAYRLNVRAGRETRLPLFTRALDSFNHEVIDSDALSPDGKWFLWSNRWGNTLVAQTGGPRHFEAVNYDAQDNYKQVLWLADSTHWIENYGVNGKCHWLILRDVRKPESALHLTVGSRAGLLCALEHVTTLQHAISVEIPARHFDREPDRHVLVVHELDLTDEKKTRKIATIHVPRGRDYTTAISPKGDRLAISLKVRLPKGGYRLEVWTCNLDGSRMRCVGFLNNREPDPQVDPGYFFRLHWLPSGKRLGFAWDDVLYTVASP